MRFAPHADRFQQPPRRSVSRVAFRIDPMRAVPERLFDHRAQRFGGIALPAIAFVDDAADFPRTAVPLSAIEIADHLSGIRKRNGIVFLRAEAFPQVFPDGFTVDPGIALKLVVFELL